MTPMNAKIAAQTIEDHKYLLELVENKAAIAYFAVFNRNQALFTALRNYYKIEERMEQDKSNTITFDVSASAERGVGVSLDLWSFRFYTKNIINYMDSKKWVELGIAVATFKEMIMTVYRMSTKGSPSVQAWSSRLIGVVFYEREIMVGSFCTLSFNCFSFPFLLLCFNRHTQNKKN